MLRIVRSQKTACTVVRSNEAEILAHRRWAIQMRQGRSPGTCLVCHRRKQRGNRAADWSIEPETCVKQDQATQRCSGGILAMCGLAKRRKL